MGRRRSKAKVSTFDQNHGYNLPAETAAAEMDVSNSVTVVAAKNDSLFQSQYEVVTIDKAERENTATLGDCSKVDKYKIDAAIEEYISEEHSADEVEMGLGEGREGEERNEENHDYYDDDVDDGDGDGDADSDDIDDFDDKGEDGNDDDFADDENGNNDDFEDDDDDFDEGDDYDDEKNDMMEEEEIDEHAKSENNDIILEEDDDSQRITVEEANKKENAEEENEEREGGSLKKKVKTLRKGRKRKKVTTEVSDKVPSKSKGKQEGNGKVDEMEETVQENRKEDIQDKGGRSKQKDKKLSERNRKKVKAGAFEKVAPNRDDKVELSRKKRSTKKVQSMGMIFMCSSKTKKDCYHYKVLGLPANKRGIVGKIYKGMRLFLYDVDLKLLYGIYKAAGPGGYNIQPRAFNSQFPSQVRFTILEDCRPLAEEKFKKVIKDNYFTKTKFDCQLTSQQVKNLCKLFVSANKVSKSIRLGRRVETHASTGRGRSRARGEKRQSAMDDKRWYHEYSRKPVREVPRKHEREVPQFLLPPATGAPSYAYDRTLELDAYRRDLFRQHLDSHRHPVPEPRDAYRTAPYLEPRDAYRTAPYLEPRDAYRRDVVVEHPNLRIRDEIERRDPVRDEIGRRDPYISYRERLQHRIVRSRDDFGRYDPYFSYARSPEDHNPQAQDEIERTNTCISYKEHAAYRDHLYGTGPLPDDDHYCPVSRSTEHLSAVARLPEYRSARPLYRY